MVSPPAHASTRPRPSRRLALVVSFLAVVVLAAVVVTPALNGPGGAFPAERAQASDAAASLLSKLNASRQANGLSPLSPASDLTAVAAERASAMARSGSLAHTPDLGGRVCCWSWIGENVAYGGSVSVLHQVLMNSAPHRANILKGDVDDVGVAVVRANGQLWAAQVFRVRSGSKGGNGSGDGGEGSRAEDASGASRLGERTSPITVVPSPSGSLAPSGPSPAEIARQQLKNRLANLRKNLKQAKHRVGGFDPVRAAVRYAGTLDRVAN